MQDREYAVGPRWQQRLLELGFAVRRHLRQVAELGLEGLTQPVAHESGDTIYGLDRQVESVITAAVAAWPEADHGLLLIAEGMGTDGRQQFGGPGTPARWSVIVDPIDGTRSLMYDKRSAWFLAAVARGDAPRLAQSCASVLVELPTSKQAWADDFAAMAGQPPQGCRRHLRTGQQQALPLQPSQATTLKDGFAQVVNFFPGTKVLASELMERIVETTLGALRPGAADVFDDQYISTGGQMVELMLGHDRFCCDLRPLFYEIIQRRTGQEVRGVECHPYDAAGMLVAQQAGVILTDGFGRPLDSPWDVHTGVHWCGYANATIQRLVEPAIRAWLQEQGLEAP